MVYKRYAKKNGKIYGPYYYESYRENGHVKKIYIGQELPSKPIVPRSKLLSFAIIFIALAILISLVLFINPTGKVTLQTEPNYAINAILSGNATITLQEGDSIQKDTQINLVLLKDNVILAETTKTLEEFLGNQISYIPITNDSISCVNITIPSEEEVCTEETIDNVTNIVCVNQTSETTEENCTTTTITDYYYQTPGSYSADLSELLDYNLAEFGDYVLRFGIPNLGIESESLFSVSAPEEPLPPVENETIPPEENETILPIENETVPPAENETIPLKNETMITAQGDVSASASMSSRTFNSTGAQQTFVVPSGVYSVNVAARGAQGGLSVGGKGGEVNATLNVTPGETLYIYVGGQGGSTLTTDYQGLGGGGLGGYNGGANGGLAKTGALTTGIGGGGGGASDIRKGGNLSANRVIIGAGGGGGGSGSSNGGNGSYPAGDNGNNAAQCFTGCKGGVGGNQTAGGAGGDGYLTYDGEAGSSGQGGRGNGWIEPGGLYNPGAGGGGGGGYYGGGGGGAGFDYGQGGGGAGASSYANDSVASNIVYAESAQSGNGTIVISYAFTNCTTISTAGVYYLGGDISISSGTCITISTSNVTLDCNGYQIADIGVSDNGISVANQRNITIRNCSVYGFDFGIKFENTNLSFVSNSTLWNNYGLYLSSSFLNNFTGNNFSLNNNGIYLTSSSNNTFSNSIISSSSSNGITLDSFCYRNRIINNTISSNGNEGIYIGASSSNTISNNNINSNIYGINTVYGNNNVIANNTMDNNVGADYSNGIHLTDSANNIITNNTFNNNKYGIFVVPSSSYSYNNTFIKNIAQNNSEWDYFDYFSNINNTITNLTTYQNLISFTGMNYAVKGLAELPSGSPAGKKNIGVYLDVISTTGSNTWMLLNFSYNDSNMLTEGINESSLKIWRYSSGTWVQDGWNGTRVLSTTNNIVGVNITNFGSTFAPLGQSIITSCPYTISSAGNYFLSNNINSSSTCISIGSNNVVLDCQGYKINGTHTASSSGVMAGGKSNVTIKNCIIEHFDNGILLQTSSNSNFILNNTVTSNSGAAADANGNGIAVLTTSINNIIDGNNASGNGNSGIFINSNSNNITNNFVDFNNGTGNRKIGIYIYSSNNYVKSNTISYNPANYGIVLNSGSTYNVVESNSLNFNAGGINGYNADWNNFTSNTASSNGDGFNFGVGSDNNRFVNNVIMNSATGFSFDNSHNNTLINNNATDNGRDFSASTNSANTQVVNLTTQQNLISFIGYNMNIKGLANVTIPVYRSYSNSSTTTISKPSGVVRGDIMIARVSAINGSSYPRMTPPTNWTTIRSLASSQSTYTNSTIYYHIAGDSEPASYTWTVTGSNLYNLAIAAFYNVDPVNPINVENGQVNTGSLTLHPTPSVTTTVNNTMIVTMFADPLGYTWTPPSGMTEAYDFSVAAAGSSTGDYVIQVATGATGVKTATTSSVTGSTAQIIALNPAPVPANPPRNRSIGKYLEMANNSATGWIYLNISYSGADVGTYEQSGTFDCNIEDTPTEYKTSARSCDDDGCSPCTTS